MDCDAFIRRIDNLVDICKQVDVRLPGSCVSLNIFATWVTCRLTDPDIPIEELLFGDLHLEAKVKWFH